MHNENKVFNPKNMSKLEHPDRYKELPPAEILSRLGLGEGHIFGDFGCGIGFFAIPAADIVGESGHVFASDISQQMIDGLHERLCKDHRKRVTAVLAGPSAVHGTGIEKAVLDRAMISTVLHEVESPQTFLENAGASLKTGGRLAIIEWIKEEMPQGPRLDIRISEEELSALFNKAGFTVKETLKLSNRFYLAIGEKK